jgi:hypothetical protein
MANNPNVVKNLKPFKKGKDPRRSAGGTPNPIVTDIKNYIRAKLSEPAAEKADYSRLDAITAKMLSLAYGGNMKAIELAMAYGYGKPIQALELTGKDDNAITIKVVRD